MAGLNCTGLTGGTFDLCSSLNAEAVTCADSEFRISDGSSILCQPYDSPAQKGAGYRGLDNVIDPGNTAFMLANAALVMIMTPGVGLFYAGLAGESTAANTLLMSVASMCIVTFQFFFIGYTLAFGPGSVGLGSFVWIGLAGANGDPTYSVGMAASGAYELTIPHVLFMIFQNMFAQITPAIISGAVVGRMKFSTWCVFVFIWTTLIYDPIAHWFWGLQVEDDFSADCSGWLCDLGALDFAGGSIIHIPSGFAGLACAIVLGKRADAGEKLKPHNVPLIMMGATFLWFGWFGFNAGSWWAIDGPATQAFLNTHIAAAAGAGSWMLVEKLHTGNITPAGTAAGVVAGLVAITPGCAFVLTYAALLFGLIVSPVCYGMMQIKDRFLPDDTLDAFALHGVGGIVGGFLTGLFADPSVNGAAGAFYGDGGYHLGVNMLGIVVSAAYSFFGTLIIMFVLDKTMGARIDSEAEQEGIDVSEHGGKSYQ